MTVTTTRPTIRGAGATAASAPGQRPTTLVWDRDRGALSATQVARIQKRITRR